MLRIDGRHDGRRVVLPIKVLRSEFSNLTAVAALALLDTGANTSGIVRRIADALDLAPTGKRPLYVARGVMQVERYLFRIGLDPSDQDTAPQFPFVFDETLASNYRTLRRCRTADRSTRLLAWTCFVIAISR